MTTYPNATLINATVVLPTTGSPTYTFSDSFDMNVSLAAVSNAQVVFNGSTGNDRISITKTAVGDTITGSGGNSQFVLTQGVLNLNKNVLTAGAGFNVVKSNTSGATVDLTGVSLGTAESTGIAGVVANHYEVNLTGQVVDLDFNGLQTSNLTDGVSGHGPAFVALIGRDGVVNFSTPANLQFVGVMDGLGDGFSASGVALSSAETATLASEVTSLAGVEGTLAYQWTGLAGDTTPTQQAAWNYLPDNLSAYVFTDGTKDYTIWSDGTVKQISSGATSTLYQPVAVTGATATFGKVAVTNTVAAAYATVAPAVTGHGLSTLTLGNGRPTTDGSVTFNPNVAQTISYSDNGLNGGIQFNLQSLAAGTVVTGTPAGDLFELGAATTLTNVIKGQGGFNVVHAAAAGAVVDLTGQNPVVKVAATDISAIVGGAATTQTVKVSLSALPVSSGMSEFEALLGSSADKLIVVAAQAWKEVATFSSSAAPITGETPITNATELDTIYGQANAAETQLSGYLFEATIAGATHYATIWTDATVAAGTNVTLLPHALVQAMSTLASASGSTGSEPPAVTPPPSQPVVLATPA